MKMADEIDFENGRISNFQRHVTLTLTLDRAIWHAVVHHSLTSTYTPFESDKLFVDGCTYGRTYERNGRMYGRTARHRGGRY